MSQYGAMIRKMHFAFFLILTGFLYVAWQMYQVQVVRHEDLYQKAKSQYTATKTKLGIRGEILDFNGNLLVSNIPVYDIGCDPSLLTEESECREIASFFARRAQEDEQVLFKRLMTKERVSRNEQTGEESTVRLRYAVIARGVSLELCKSLKKEVEQRGWPGFRFDEGYRRFYPKGKMLANILGFTKLDQGIFIAQLGMEKTLDTQMKPGKSVTRFERTRDGKPITYGNFEETPVQDGANIYLTVHEPIQGIVEEELDKVMATLKPQGVMAVMVDPYKGDILAIAQRPSYDPNDRAGLTGHPEYIRNHVVEDYFEPGSVMKTFVVASAIDQDVVTPDTIIDCTEGLWYYAKRPLRDTHPVRKVPVTGVITQSSNIGTAKISLMLGTQRLYQALRMFGFGQKTGIPLQYESPGSLAPPNKWSGLSITRLCIGQGIAVTALQIVRAYCMIANGGYPVNLRLVDRVDRDGITEKYPYVRGEYVFRKKNTAEIMKRMLKTVTEPGGTAKAAAIPGYHVAGKTGTAEQAVNGRYADEYFASFCGFVPWNKPRFVLYVVIARPPVVKGVSHTGGAIAAPVFKNIAERTLKYLHEPLEMPLEEWEAERSALWKADHQKRVQEDERVRQNRLKRDAAKP